MAHDHDHEESPEQLQVKFEQLSLLESEFEDAESEISKQQHALRISASH